MQLKQIYRPIEKELIDVEEALRNNLHRSRYKSILETSNYLLYARGKRLRPALVLLSAKAAQQSRTAQPAYAPDRNQLINIASAVELIHMASLIHDDVIDHSQLRHNRPTINYKWGQETAIVLGDYFYSLAFELISTCGNMEILQCISSATKTMCEGELLQVCERDNLDLLKRRYIVIVKKKTAALFAACCQAGSLISNFEDPVGNILKEYGLNLGIAFQITDDYLDLVGEQKNLGKTIGQDIRVGEFTLPILNLWESLPGEKREELRKLLTCAKQKKVALGRIKKILLQSGTVHKTKNTTQSFINLAKEKLVFLSNSDYKESLFKLADFTIKRGFSANN